MKKEDIRILWNESETGKICEFLIQEFPEDSPELWDQSVYKRFRKDVGNCLKPWNKWTITDIFYEFFWGQEWESIKLKDDFLDAILEVEGFEYIPVHPPGFFERKE